MIAPGTKRLNIVAVRLTDAERAALDALTGASGMRPSDVMRRALATLKAQQDVQHIQPRAAR